MGGSVFTVAGGKGGVGKTTTTANVGIALAREGLDVAAVDADLGMTNLGSLLGIEPERGIHDVLAERASVSEVLVDGPGGLRVVPGERGLPPVEAADPANLKRVVRPLADAVDVVLVDTGAGVSHENLVACGLADAVALVATPDALAVGDAHKASELADRVDAPVLGTVLTRVPGERDGDAAGGAAESAQPAADEAANPDVDPERVAAAVEEPILGTVPEYADRDAAEPRVLEAPDSPAAAAYEHVARTLRCCHETGHTTDAAAALRAADVGEEAIGRVDETTTERAEEGTADPASIGGFLRRLSPS